MLPTPLGSRFTLSANLLTSSNTPVEVPIAEIPNLSILYPVRTHLQPASRKKRYEGRQFLCDEIQKSVDTCLE